MRSVPCGLPRGGSRFERCSREPETREGGWRRSCPVRASWRKNDHGRIRTKYPVLRLPGIFVSCAPHDVAGGVAGLKSSGPEVVSRSGPGADSPVPDRGCGRGRVKTKPPDRRERPGRLDDRSGRNDRNSRNNRMSGTFGTTGPTGTTERPERPECPEQGGAPPPSWGAWSAAASAGSAAAEARPRNCGAVRGEKERTKGCTSRKKRYICGNRNPLSAMKNRLNRLLYGKNSKPLYFVRNVVRYLTPKRLTQARLAGVLAELEQIGRAHV